MVAFERTLGDRVLQSPRLHWGRLGSLPRFRGPAQSSASRADVTTHGFTGHEMLDAAGLIHMNGRLYDPELGRFLQADPFIQFLAHTQGHNRYSYVLNNPASLTDPTGHFVGGVAILAAQVLATHLVHKHVLSQVPLLNAVANVLACAYGGAPGCINFAVHSAYARTGSFGAALEAGVLSAVSVAAFDAVGASAAFGYGSGDGFGRLAMNALANGVVGGIANELQGGRFGHGFMSAGVGALAKPGIRAAFGVKAKGAPHRIAARAILGGTLTAATGGKFANGAVTGAFSQTFNEERTLAFQEKSSQNGTSEDWRKNVGDIEKLESLSDEFRPKAIAVLRDLVGQGYKLRIVWGRRSQEENKDLVYKKVASKNSAHLIGNALDFVNRRIGYKNMNDPLYTQAVGQAAKDAGVVWGGHFRSMWDPNHIELKKE